LITIASWNNGILGKPCKKAIDGLLSNIPIKNSCYNIGELVSNLFYLHKLLLSHGQTDSSFDKCGVNLEVKKRELPSSGSYNTQ